MAEIGSAFVSIIPSAKGFASKLGGQLGTDADVAGRTLGSRIGKAAAIGIAAGIGGAVALTKGLYEIGSVFDDVSDTIRVGTGATGAALESLNNTAKNVGRSIPVAFDEIGPVVADLNTRLGTTGPVLEKLTKQFLEAGRITGEALDVNTFTAAFNAFGVQGEKTTKVMDTFYRISQATGVSLNDLASSVARNAPNLKQFGFTIGDSAALIGNLDKAGIDSNRTLATLSRALVQFAKDGKEPQAALRGTIDQIGALIKSGDQAAAIDLAGGIFGTRGASQFVAAIKSGKLNLDTLMKSTGATSDTILRASKDTSDFSESLQLFKNRVLIALEPVATRVFNALGNGMAKLASGDALGKVTRAFRQLQAQFESGKGAGGAFRTILTRVKDAAETVGPALASVTKAVGSNKTAVLAIVSALAAYKVAVLAYVGYTKAAAAVTAVHTAAVALSTSTFGTRVGVMALDAAAWVRSTASTVASTVATTANNVVTGISNLNIGTRIGLLAGSVASWVASTAATVANTVATTAANVASKAFAAAQLLVNAALNANPIGLVVIAVAALVAGFIYAYKNSDTFRNAIDTLGRTFKSVFSAIQRVVGAALSFIKAHWRTILVILGGPIGLAVALISKHFDKIQAGAQAVIGWVKRNWPAIKALITGPFETAKTVIGKVWTALRQGASRVKEVITRVFNAISSAIQGAIDKAQSLIDKLDKIAARGKGTGIKAGQGRRAAGVDAGQDLGNNVLIGLAMTERSVVDGVAKVADKAGKKLKEKISKLRDQLASIKDDFAGLVDPISSNFTQGLFEFDTAGAFTANLQTVKGTLTTLLSNFKKLIGEGLSPGFLYKLFESGGPGLINSLAALPQADAQAAGSLFGDVTSLADQLGTNVAGSTQQGAALLAEQKRTNDKLDRLIHATKDGSKRIADSNVAPARNARRRARGVTSWA